MKGGIELVLGFLKLLFYLPKYISKMRVVYYYWVETCCIWYLPNRPDLKNCRCGLHVAELLFSEYRRGPGTNTFSKTSVTQSLTRKPIEKYAGTWENGYRGEFIQLFDLKK